MVVNYITSWLLNFLVISIIVALVDKNMYNEIEKHQGLGAFLIFFIPTVLELVSYYLFNQPFFWNLV